VVEVHNLGLYLLQQSAKMFRDLRVQERIAKMRDPLEIIYHAYDGYPLHVITDDLMIRPRTIRLTAKHMYGMAAPREGAGDLARVALHTTVGAGRVAVGDE
jgi:hypothetical protein